jgi:hypothetical protein
LNLQTANTNAGRALFNQVGCSTCHIANFTIESDRRRGRGDRSRRNVAGRAAPAGRRLQQSVRHRFDALPGGANSADALGFPIIEPQGEQFPRRGQSLPISNVTISARPLHERNFDTTIQATFMTEALWVCRNDGAVRP